MRSIGLNGVASIIVITQLAGCSARDPGGQTLPTVVLPAQSTAPGVSTAGGATATAEPGPGAATSTSGSTAPGGALPTTTEMESSSGLETTKSDSKASSESDATITSGSESTTGQDSTSSSPSTDGQSSSPGSSDDGSDSDEPGDSQPSQRARWTKGHGDIQVVWDEAKGALVPQIHLSDDALVDGKLDPDGKDRVFSPAQVSVVLSHRIERQEAQAGAEFDPTCIGVGESMFFVPSVPVKDAPVPFLGIANRIRDSAPIHERRIVYAFQGIKGPNEAPVQFSMWQFQAKGLKFFASSCDGFDANDEMPFGWGHDHFDMGFAGPAGPWELSIRAKAKLDDGSSTHVDFTVHFEFLDSP